MWFSARLLIEALNPEERVKEKLFEDRIVLVRAVSDADALRRAKKFGKEAQHQYKNVHGKKVIWKFRKVMDVVELLDDPLKEGSEVYYSLLNKTQLNSLRRTLDPPRKGRSKK